MIFIGRLNKSHCENPFSQDHSPDKPRKEKSLLNRNDFVPHRFMQQTIEINHANKLKVQESFF